MVRCNSRLLPLIRRPREILLCNCGIHHQDIDWSIAYLGREFLYRSEPRQVDELQLSRISLGLAAASLIYSAIHILAYGSALTLNLLAGGACAAFQSLILISASRQVRSTHAHAVITHRWFVSPYETRSVLALGALALLWFVVFVLGIARRTAVASPIARFLMFIPNIAAGVEAVVVGPTWLGSRED